MVGGNIIEIEKVPDTGRGPDLYNLWVVNGFDELIVTAKNPKRLPSIGSQCWWQAGKIFCENDKLVLDKYGCTHNLTPTNKE